MAATKSWKTTKVELERGLTPITHGLQCWCTSNHSQGCGCPKDDMLPRLRLNITLATINAGKSPAKLFRELIWKWSFFTPAGQLVTRPAHIAHSTRTLFVLAARGASGHAATLSCVSLVGRLKVSHFDESSSYNINEAHMFVLLSYPPS